MRPDNFEQEVEYERLCDSLSGKGSDDLAAKFHSIHTQLGGGSKLIHLHAVAELASKHADAYYAESDFHEQRYWKLSCRLAGLLHESMEWGGTFEEIVAVSDESVAQLVAELTPDKRVPRPKRLEILLNRIGRASEPTQIVKLADLQHECFHLLTVNFKKAKPVLVTEVANWLHEAREILRVVDKIQESSPLLAQLADLRVKLSLLAKNCQYGKMVKNGR